MIDKLKKTFWIKSLITLSNHKVKRIRFIFEWMNTSEIVRVICSSISQEEVLWLFTVYSTSKTLDKKAIDILWKYWIKLSSYTKDVNTEKVESDLFMLTYEINIPCKYVSSIVSLLLIKDKWLEDSLDFTCYLLFKDYIINVYDDRWMDLKYIHDKASKYLSIYSDFNIYKVYNKSL